MPDVGLSEFVVELDVDDGGSITATAVPDANENVP